jgi:hypothetical protein
MTIDKTIMSNFKESIPNLLKGICRPYYNEHTISVEKCLAISSFFDKIQIQAISKLYIMHDARPRFASTAFYQQTMSVTQERMSSHSTTQRWSFTSERMYSHSTPQRSSVEESSQLISISIASEMGVRRPDGSGQSYKTLSYR